MNKMSVGGPILPPTPPPAPAFPSAPRFSDAKLPPAPPNPKFPSFSMDLDDMDLQDVTNIPDSTRHSVRHSVRHSIRQTGTFDNSVDFADPLVTVDTVESGDKGADTMSSAPWDEGSEYDMHSSPVQASTGKGMDDDDDDDDDNTGFDVPNRLAMGADAAAARLDLHRCTIRVHKQLFEQMKTHSMRPANQTSPSGAGGPRDLLRCQGELWLRSRVPMRGWKRRYGSIVDHAFFGPVLFLFKYDAKGDVALHNSMMIVLVDSHVRLGKNTVTREKDYRCEFTLKTTRRRYTIAASHTMRRDYWIRNLEGIQHKSATRRS